MKSDRLLTRRVLFRSYGVVGMIEAMVGFFSYFYILFNGGWQWGESLSYLNPLYQKSITAFFFSIILMQVANVFICRARSESLFKKGFFSNHLLLFGVLVEVSIALFIVYSPFAHAIFNTRDLTFFELMLSLPFVFLLVALDELRKFGLRKKNKFVKKYLSW